MSPRGLDVLLGVTEILKVLCPSRWDHVRAVHNAGAVHTQPAEKTEGCETSWRRDSRVRRETEQKITVYTVQESGKSCQGPNPGPTQVMPHHQAGGTWAQKESPGERLEKVCAHTVVSMQISKWSETSYFQLCCNSFGSNSAFWGFHDANIVYVY